MKEMIVKRITRKHTYLTAPDDWDAISWYLFCSVLITLVLCIWCRMRVLLHNK